MAWFCVEFDPQYPKDPLHRCVLIEEHDGPHQFPGYPGAKVRSALANLLAALECSPAWFDWSSAPEVIEAQAALTAGSGDLEIDRTGR